MLILTHSMSEREKAIEREDGNRGGGSESVGEATFLSPTNLFGIQVSWLKRKMLITP